MNSMEIDLWSRIDGYAFDTVDAALPFSARLARDNNWSVNFAKRAIEEYKKFVFLAMTAGHPVTPSDEVDQVWHLHLLYTRSYWEDFSRILGKPLHHGPTRGGVDEGMKFHTWYQNTLDSYSKVFAVAPPADVWPEPTARFGDALQFKRINTGNSWVIPKPKWSAPLILAAIVTPLVLLAGCVNVSETELLFPILILVFILVAVFRDAKAKGKKNDGEGGGGGCGAGNGDGSGCGGGSCGGGCGG